VKADNFVKPTRLKMHLSFRVLKRTNGSFTKEPFGPNRNDNLHFKTNKNATKNSSKYLFKKFIGQMSPLNKHIFVNIYQRMTMEDVTETGYQVENARP